MIRSVRRAAVTAAAVAILATAACDAAPPADPGFAGHWTSSEWGDHYILVEGTSVKIIYLEDGGRVVGRLDGSTVTGWWTREPSRNAPADAGEVGFRLEIYDGVRTVDGAWRYGSQGPVQDHWDLTWVGPEVPDEIMVQFADATTFVARPR